VYKLLGLPILVLAMVGCGQNFNTIRTDPVCTEYPWFLDADGDGWGDPDTTGIVQCDADDASGYVVQNNRDCDDADASITARAGSLCPAEVVLGTGSIEQFAIGNTEYLVADVSSADITDGSSVVWPEYARDVCGPEGWGGTYVVVDGDGTIHEDQIDTARDPAGLFVANDPQELVDVGAHVTSEYWATWIRAVGDSGTWTWDVQNQTPLTFSDLGGFCDNISDPTADPALQQLALIKRKLDGDTEARFCVGNPDQVWGRYFKDVFTASDGDGDGLANGAEAGLGTDPDDADSDDDGIGDGQEVDVMGTDPDSSTTDPDPFAILEAGADPRPAFQTELAYFVCERERPDPVRFAMSELPGLDGPE
jgi:hypothetical protein